MHIEDPELASLFSFVSVEVEVEESAIQVLDQSSLDVNWRRWPHSKDCQEVGNHWVESMSSLVLQVPSSIVPTQSNYLVNPDHPDFNKLKIGPSQTFTIDKRLFR